MSQSCVKELKALIHILVLLYKDNDVSVEENPLTAVSLVHPVGTQAQVIYVAPINIGGGGIAGAGSAGGYNNNDSDSAANVAIVAYGYWMLRNKMLMN
jgi:hypothetical protein